MGVLRQNLYQHMGDGIRSSACALAPHSLPMFSPFQGTTSLKGTNLGG